MPVAPTTAVDLLPQVVWFKRDLRVQDHAALACAMAAGPTLCVYAVELNLKPAVTPSPAALPEGLADQ